MAAKSKAAPKKAKAKVTAKAKAGPKGLQLSSAQAKAYNKAYNAAATAARNRLALLAFAKGLRKYRLAAAYATQKRYQAARSSAQAAAVAANATRMTWKQSVLAHQNTALQARIEQEMYTHANLLGRLQFAQAGEKAYMHKAVMRTLTASQAISYEAALLKKVSRTARKAAKSTLSARKYKAGPNSKAIAKAAAAAGTRAAQAVKVPKAAKGAKARTAPLRWNPHGVAAPPRKPEVKKPWAGDETTPNCIATAIANHLLHLKGVPATDDELQALTEMCGDEPRIEEVLWKVWLSGWPCNGRVRLATYTPVEWSPAHETSSCLVIGYKAETDDGPKDHAALSLAGSKVVSWGSVADRTAPVEEAWDLLWQA